MERLKKLLSEITFSGKGYASKTTKDLKSKKGDVIPAGTAVVVKFVDDDKSDRLSAVYPLLSVKAGDTEIKVFAHTAYKKLKGFIKPPNDKALEKWVSDGTAKSLTGRSVEVDGHDQFGFPAWTLALGLV